MTMRPTTSSISLTAAAAGEDGDAVPAGGRELDFADGLPGFPDSRRFVVESVAADSDFQLLRSVDEPDVAMVVTVPWTFFPAYAPELDDQDVTDLDLQGPEEVVVFCPVTLDAATRTAYVNLLGPCIVNARTRRARQVVLTGSDHPLRAPVSLDSGAA